MSCTPVTVAILRYLLELVAAPSDQKGPSCRGGGAAVKHGSCWLGFGRALVWEACRRSAVWVAEAEGGFAMLRSECGPPALLRLDPFHRWGT